MDQGISESVIVVVKLGAYDDMVTYLRTKLTETAKAKSEAGRRTDRVNV
jgi:hypothetical protein